MFGATEQRVVEAARRARDTGSADFSAVYKGLVDLQQENKNNAHEMAADLAELNSRIHALGLLPGLEITGADDDNHLTAVKGGKQVEIVASDVHDVFEQKVVERSWWEKAGNVVSSIGRGAFTEITEHYGRVAGSGATGFAVGLGVSLLAPEIAAVVGIAGLGMAAYGVITNAPKWYHDARVVANPERFSVKEIQRADHGMQNFGAGAVDITAGVAGGMAGAKFARSEMFNSIKDSIGKRWLTGKAELPEIRLSKDAFSIKGSVPGDEIARVRAMVSAPGEINVTDINRGALVPKGSGGDFLAEVLKGHNQLPTKELRFTIINNPPTIEAYQAGLHPSKSVLGECGTKALESLGIKPTSYSWQIIKGKLALIIKTGG